MIFCCAMERKWLKYDREIRLAGFLLVMTLILSNLAAALLFNGAVRHYRGQMESGLAAAARMAESIYNRHRPAPARDLEIDWAELAKNFGLSAIGMADSNGQWLAATNRFLLDGYLFDLADQERTMGWSKLKPGRMARDESREGYGYVNYSLREGASGNILVLLAPAGSLPAMEAAARLQNIWTVVVFLAALAGLLLYLRLIFGPFRQMASLARSGSSGRRGSDVELVMEGFREMVSQLKREGRELSDRFDRERTRAEDLEQFSRQILKSVDKGIVCLDNQGMVLACNPAAREIMGREVRTWSDLMGREEYEAIQGGGRQVIREIGGSAIIRIEASRLKNASGQVIGLNLVISDITDQKKMEELEGLTEKSALLQNAYQVLLAKVGPLLQEISKGGDGGGSLERAASELGRLISEQGRFFSYQEGAERAEGSGMVCASPDMKQAMELAGRVAPADSTVLITGASGTGKELVARQIHRLSPRADKPFVTINCAALPENLLESELFGYAKGAFTGALRDKPGLLKAADGGTFFLDEVGELPPGLQAKILRAIQEKEITPVGSTRPVAIDVRFIAASNRDLEAMVKAGSFRQDLFYRLNVFPIQLTPLSQRPEDIEPLVRHFMEKHGRKNNRPAMTIEPRALAALKKQAWPGNVRELENLIERAVLFSRGGRIRLADLRLTEGSKGEPEEGLLEAASRAAARAEAELIGRVLAECGGNKSQTAKRLKISYRVMLKKIRDYRLE